MNNNKMQFQNSLPIPQQPDAVAGFNKSVPGKLNWFEPGSDEYGRWAAQRSQFIREIDTETEAGKEVLMDIFDTLIESEVPTGLISIISTSLKISKKARMLHKRRKLWQDVICAVVQLTFTPPSHNDDEFVFSIHQIQHVWRGFGGDSLSTNDYKKLYSTIDTKMRVGKLKNKILNFPELDNYVGYKLRQFKDSFHRYQMGLIEY